MTTILYWKPPTRVSRADRLLPDHGLHLLRKGLRPETRRMFFELPIAPATGGIVSPCAARATWKPESVWGGDTRGPPLHNRARSCRVRVKNPDQAHEMEHGCPLCVVVDAAFVAAAR